ncbi:MAG: zeta toxin family protein [Ginsengibacter sp.]
MPSIYIIAGCNGAGKTTAAYNLLPGVFKTIEFVNADEIARGLSPFNPEGVAFQAGRIMLERLNDLTSRKTSFAFETTLAGLSYINFIQLAKLEGYDITFFFIWLDNVELAKKRVATRVHKGGHNIPEDVIERRYIKGIKNLPKYLSEADNWYIYDNSGPEYLLVAKFIEGEKIVSNFELYNKIKGNEEP